MQLAHEFRKFAMRGNVVDMAVGIVIGAAFSKIVSSLVSNILMPPLNLLTAKYGVNFTELAIKIRTLSPVVDETGKVIMEGGAPKMSLQDYPILNYGPFLQTIVEFLLIALAIFLAIKLMNTAKARFEEEKVVEELVQPTPEEIVLLREIRDQLAGRADDSDLG